MAEDGETAHQLKSSCHFCRGFSSQHLRGGSQKPIIPARLESDIFSGLCGKPHAHAYIHTHICTHFKTNYVCAVYLNFRRQYH